LTIRPRLQAGAPDDSDSREDVWSNAPAVKANANPATRIGSNENTPRIPEWLASHDRSAQPGHAANVNGDERIAPSAGRAGGGAGRDWLYDWDTPPAAGTPEQGRRRRLFLPRGTAARPSGRPVARRLVLSAACLAIVAAAGGGFVLFSRHQARVPAIEVAQVAHKKAPSVIGNTTVAKSQETKQAKAEIAQGGMAKAPAAATQAPVGVNETQKVAALPVRGKVAAVAASVPSPDSARWATNVVSHDQTLASGHGAKAAPATQPMAAFAPASVNKAPAPDVRPTQDAKPAAEVKAAPEVKSASLTPEPKADGAQTSSIPENKDVAEKARATMGDVERSAAKPIDTGGSHVVVTTAVKLHASAENHSRVLMVVPAKASVQLFNCDQWCKIVYDGHEGYIYKDFVKHPGRAPVAAAGSTKTASKVASSGSDSNKLIGGTIVDDGAAKPAAASEPAANPAAPKPAQPAAVEPPTMSNDSR